MFRALYYGRRTGFSERGGSIRCTEEVQTIDFQLREEPLRSASLLGAWGTSSTDVYAVGENGTILHYDGTEWSSMVSGTNERLTGVWGVSSSDVYTVGSSGTILHYDGTGWSAMTSKTGHRLNDVWGTSSSSDIYAVGTAGTILHYDGTGWSAVTN